jgi:hypothetical protein
MHQSGCGSRQDALFEIGLLLAKRVHFGRFLKPGDFREPKNPGNSEITVQLRDFRGWIEPGLDFLRREKKSGLIYAIGRRKSVLVIREHRK